MATIPAGWAIALAALAFAAITVARWSLPGAEAGVALLYTVPVALLAFRFGYRGGIAAAAGALLLFVAWAVANDEPVGALGYASRGVAFLTLGALVGLLAERLATQSARFDLALSNSPVYTFNQDLELRYTWTDRSWNALSEVDVVGLTDDDLLAPDEASHVKRIKRRAIETGAQVRAELSVSQTGQQPRWFEIVVEPTRDPAGRVNGIAGAAFEITDLKHANEALALSEQRFRSAADNLLEPFALYTPIRGDNGEIIDFYVEYANRPAAESVGIPLEEMIGEAVSEVFAGRLEFGLFDQYVRVLETGEPYFEDAVHFVNVFGRETLVRAFDVRIAKLGDGVEVTWRDITDRLNAERDREWLAAVVESSVDAVMSIDNEGNIVSWSPSCESLWGYTADEAIGKPIRSFYPDRYAPQRLELLGRLLNGESIGPIEVIELRKDGTEIALDFSAAPIKDRDGRVIGVARIARPSVARAEPLDSEQAPGGTRVRMVTFHGRAGGSD